MSLLVLNASANKATDTDTLDIVLLDSTHQYRPYYTSILSGATGGTVYERVQDWTIKDLFSHADAYYTATALIDDCNEDYCAAGGYNRMYYCAASSNVDGGGAYFILDTLTSGGGYKAAYVIHNGDSISYKLDDGSYIDYDTLDADGLLDCFGELNTTVIYDNTYAGDVLIPSYVRYKAAWGTEYIIPVVGIDANCFYNSANLTSITIQDGVSEIGNNAIRSASKLTKTVLPSTLTDDASTTLTVCVNNWNFWISCAKTDTIICYMDEPFYYNSDEYFCNRGSSYEHYIFVKPYCLGTYLEEQSTTADIFISEKGWGKLDTLDNVHILPFTDQTVSSAGAATLALPYTCNIPDSVKAYTLTAEKTDTEIIAKATLVTTDTLGRDSVVYIEAPAGDYVFYGVSQTVTDEDETPTNGCLVGEYSEDGSYVPGDSSCYVLQNQPSVAGVAFYNVKKADYEFVAQYRAYAQISDDEDETASVVRIVFGDEDDDPDNNGGQTTGITSVEAIAENASEDAPVYNLQGIRVSGDNLPAGIYIKNGRKFIVK